MLCNASTSVPGALLRNVTDVLLGASLPPQPVPIDTVPRTLSLDAKRRWVGTYHDTLGHGVLRVRLAGDTLLLGDGRRLVPTSDTTTRVGASSNALVLRSVAGQVSALVQVPRTTRDLVFRREAPFAPPRAALGAYAGSYYSDELDVRYDLTLEDSTLVVHHRKLDDPRLTPAFRDAFTLESGAAVQFTRDRSDQVTGFAISDGRVRGVRFDRVK